MKIIKAVRPPVVITTSLCSLWLSAASVLAQTKLQIPDQVKDLIVMISGDFADTKTIGAGIIFGLEDERLLIATSNHVVRQYQEPAKNLQIVFNMLRGEKLGANLLSDFDIDLDLAVLSVADPQKQKMPIKKLQFKRLGDANKKIPEDKLYYVGFAHEKPWEPFVEQNLNFKIDKFTLLFQSNLLLPGQSGGGLFNEHWELIGMIKDVKQPYGRAVEINSILAKLREWKYEVDLTDAGGGIPIWIPLTIVGSGAAGYAAWRIWCNDPKQEDDLSVLPPGRPRK